MKRLTVVFAAFALAACGANAENAGATRAESAAGEVSGTPVLGAFVVALTEWRIELPMDTVPSGRYSFRVENTGTTAHGLEIEGNGREWETGDLKPGESSELTVELEPGTYEVYCPVEQPRTGEHEDRGMKRTLVVRAG